MNTHPLNDLSGFGKVPSLKDIQPSSLKDMMGPALKDVANMQAINRFHQSAIPEYVNVLNKSLFPNWDVDLLKEVQKAATQAQRVQDQLISSMTTPRWIEEMTLHATEVADGLGSARYMQDLMKQVTTLPAFQQLTEMASARQMLDAYEAANGQALRSFRHQMPDVGVVASYQEAFRNAQSLFQGNATNFAKELIERAESFLSPQYTKYFDQAVAGIDFAAVQSAAAAAWKSLYEDIDIDEVTSVDDVAELVQRADFSKLQLAIVEAVAKACSVVLGKNLSASNKVVWMACFIQVLCQVTCTLAQMYGQPISAHFDEAGNRKSSTTLTRDGSASAPLHLGQFASELTPRSSSRPLLGQTLTSQASIKLMLGPDTKQRVVAAVPPGQILRPVRRQRDWVLVEYADPLGDGASVRGWVRSRYVRSMTSETQRLFLCALEQTPDDGCGE
jgi:hypothetical protein